LDDVIVYAKTHRELFETKHSHFSPWTRLTLEGKHSKCTLFKTRISFLGHVVSQQGVDPELEQIEAIRDWPTPKRVRDVRAFFGLCPVIEGL